MISRQTVCPRTIPCMDKLFVLEVNDLSLTVCRRRIPCMDKLFVPKANDFQTNRLSKKNTMYGQTVFSQELRKTDKPFFQKFEVKPFDFI